MVAAVVGALSRATWVISRASPVQRGPQLALCMHRFAGGAAQLPWASTPGKMPHLTTLWRGQYHGLTPVFLPTHSVRSRVALRHGAPHLVQARHVHPTGGGQSSPSSSAPPSPNRLRASRTSPIVPCVSEKPCIPNRLLRCHPVPWRRPPDVPARWTPRGTFVPTPLVTIAAGWGSTTCGPMAIPVVARGGSCTVPRARAISLSITARSFMASRLPWSASCTCWPAWPKAWASGPQRGPLK